MSMGKGVRMGMGMGMGKGMGMVMGMLVCVMGPFVCVKITQLAGGHPGCQLPNWNVGWSYL